MDAMQARLGFFSTADFNQKSDGEKAQLRRQMFQELLVYFQTEESPVPHLKAMQLMRDNGAAAATTRGDRPWAVGMEFRYRAELVVLRLHSQTQAGICRVEVDNIYSAAAIVASGGYEDDEYGMTTLTYTGHGGQSEYRTYEPKVQVEDQRAQTFGHRAMVNAYTAQAAIRVIKGEDIDRGDKQYKKYTYDGMYRFRSAPVTKTGKSGKVVNVYYLE